MRAAITINRAVRKFMEKRKKPQDQQSMNLQNMVSQVKGNLSPELKNSIIIHASVFRLEDILSMRQVRG